MPIENDSGNAYANFARIANDHSSESAPAQALRATISLAKPAQMNLVQRILHFFGLSATGNAHAEQVRDKATALVFNICSAHPEDGAVSHSHETTMRSFVELRNMAKTQYQGQFSFDFKTVKGPEGNGREASSIHYQVHIAGTTLLSASIDANDRKGILAFHQAMVSTGIVPSALSMPASSVEHADAKLLNELEHTLPKLVLSDAPPSMASLAVLLDKVSTDPRFVDTPHAAMGEKVRMLSDAFPGQRFSIDFTDHDHYAITVLPAGKNVAVPLYRAEIGADLQEQAQLPALVSSGIKQSLINEMAAHRTRMHDRDSFILTNAQTMCELNDPTDLEKLMREKQNPDYSSAKLEKDFTYDNSRGTFTAHFGDKSMVFSNRAGSAAEMRGERLRMRLSQPFDNLEQIMREDHLTAKDQAMTYMLNPIRMNYVIALELTDQERAEVYREVGDTTVGDTTVTLREIWDLPAPAALPGSRDTIPDGVASRAVSVAVIDDYFDPSNLV